MTAPVSHKHVWEQGGPDTLLLLHGTGGDEHDLLALGRELAPGASLLSPRGNVLEGAMPRFFKRLAEGVFDLADLERRTKDLAAFVREAAESYDFDLDRITAVGFSNGANIAASVLLRDPGLLKRAVLFRAMVPFEPEQPLRLEGTSVYIGAGRLDPIIPQANVERLAAILRDGGAAVTLDWQPAGHGLTKADVDNARDWLEKQAVGGRR
ncbi:MAG TPA: alpha/beta hydrolase [Gemmatimonadaceae bacterium]|nr:alpha/beta hydrolase [Gemmatimonadaceae bacterium]